MLNLENGDGSGTSKIPYGEPRAGKLHVAPLPCYGGIGRFHEGGTRKGGGALLYAP